MRATLAIPSSYTADPGRLAIHEAALEIMKLTTWDYQTAVRMIEAHHRHAATQASPICPADAHETSARLHATAQTDSVAYILSPTIVRGIRE